MAAVATLSKGYDLDYVWKQVDRGLAKDAASYYIQASETGGEPPGRWWGPGARALGFEPGQTVERRPYDLQLVSAKPLMAPGWAGHQVMAGMPLTCTPSCWRPSRTPLPNASASSGPRPSRRPGKVRCSST